MAYLDENNLIAEIVDEINLVLSKNKILENISPSDITVTEKTVSDLVKPAAKLSALITDHLWPSIASATVYHYTSQDSAEKILNSGIFRLTNIEKRFVDNEIRTFCETHGLKGYLEPGIDGAPKYRSLIMPNTYYASFTETVLSKSEEDYFWSTFSGGDGVRLKFEIHATNPNFRKIHYELKAGKPIPVLDQLTKSILNKFAREFILKGISRLCSFYLCGTTYGKEREYRMLHRVWENFGPQPTGSGSTSYIELPLDTITECGYRLKVVEVHSCDRPRMPATYLFSKRVV